MNAKIKQHITSSLRTKFLKITINSFEDFMKMMIMMNFVYLSDLQLSHLDKQLEKVFIDGYFKVPKPYSANNDT